jgi:hypothetical protein
MENNLLLHAFLIKIASENILTDFIGLKEKQSERTMRRPSWSTSFAASFMFLQNYKHERFGHDVTKLDII